jgi:hypothetical protein
LCNPFRIHLSNRPGAGVVFTEHLGNKGRKGDHRSENPVPEHNLLLVQEPEDRIRRQNLPEWQPWLLEKKLPSTFRFEELLRAV